MPHDDVRRVGERDLAAAEPDAAAGRGLAGDGEVALGRHRGDQLDVAADVEHDEAVRGADGVAERARAGVVEVGDVIDDAVPRAGRLLAEALRAREGERGPGRCRRRCRSFRRCRSCRRAGGAAAPRRAGRCPPRPRPVVPPRPRARRCRRAPARAAASRRARLPAVPAVPVVPARARAAGRAARGATRSGGLASGRARGARRAAAGSRRWNRRRCRWSPRRPFPRRSSPEAPPAPGPWLPPLPAWSPPPAPVLHARSQKRNRCRDARKRGHTRVDVSTRTELIKKLRANLHAAESACGRLRGRAANRVALG